MLKGQQLEIFLKQSSYHSAPAQLIMVLLESGENLKKSPTTFQNSTSSRSSAMNIQEQELGSKIVRRSYLRKRHKKQGEVTG